VVGVVHPVAHAPYHEALSTNFIRLTSAGNDDDGLSIERCQGFNSFIAQTVVQVCPGTTTFNDRNLTRDTWYSYRVRAFNRPGNSAYSNVIRLLRLCEFISGGKTPDR
jgi:hypothetical protein